ncbi:MAG: N-acetylmuramoyl-L-alanine amidase-like domain-containing protein [Bdellovibrionota bacterium]
MKIWVSIGAVLLSFPTFAQDTDLAGCPKDPLQYEAEKIIGIKSSASNLEEAIDAVSRHFLGRPFDGSGPLGEGTEVEGGDGIDEDPRYNLQGFDCVTLVESVIALSNASSFASFKTLSDQVRYAPGSKICYASRNHFAEADWIPNNVAAGFLKDITQDVGGASVSTVETETRKKEWLLAKTLKDIKLVRRHEETDDQLEKRKLLAFEKLRESAKAVEDKMTVLPYVPLEALFEKYKTSQDENPFAADLAKDMDTVQKKYDKYLAEATNGAAHPAIKDERKRAIEGVERKYRIKLMQPSIDVLTRIPSGTVVSIIRKDWPPNDKKTGKEPTTRILVSHQAVLIRGNDGKLVIRQASFNKKVEDKDFIDYLVSTYADSPTMVGVHFAQILARTADQDLHE